MSKRGYSTFVVSTLIALLLVSGVCAVGITIARNPIVTFQPGYERSEVFLIINGADYETDVKTSLGGDLAPFANISTDLLTLGAHDVKPISVRMKLPESLPEGEHNLYITARELGAKGTATSSATTAVTVFLRVNVPYVGKYLRAKISVGPNTVENTSVQPSVYIEDLGTIDITDAYAVIVFKEGDKQLGTVATNHVPISSKGDATVYADWPNSVRAGTYEAYATVYGDEKKTFTNTTFLIGDLDIGLVNITKELYAGKVNSIDFTLLNRWNQPLNNIRVVITATTTDESRYFKATGQDIYLFPWTATSEEFFMNLPANAPDGTYKGNVNVQFGGKSKDLPTEFIVHSAAIEAPASSPISQSMSRILIIVILIVLIFIYIRQRSKEKKVNN